MLSGWFEICRALKLKWIRRLIEFNTCLTVFLAIRQTALLYLFRRLLLHASKITRRNFSLMMVEKKVRQCFFSIYLVSRNFYTWNSKITDEHHLKHSVDNVTCFIQVTESVGDSDCLNYLIWKIPMRFTWFEWTSDDAECVSKQVHLSFATDDDLLFIYFLKIFLLFITPQLWQIKKRHPTLLLPRGESLCFNYSPTRGVGKFLFILPKKKIGKFYF